jgi:hypothetical protein
MADTNKFTEGQKGLHVDPQTGEKSTVVYSVKRGGWETPEDYVANNNVETNGAKGFMENIGNALVNPKNREMLGGLAGGITGAALAPETGGLSVAIPILSAMFGGAAGNSSAQAQEQGKVDPIEALMGGVRQGGWETGGQALRLPSALGMDKRLYRGTGNFVTGAGLTPEKARDAVDFAFKNGIITPSGAERAGLAANDRTNSAVQMATANRPPVAGYLPQATELHIAGNAPPTVAGGRPGVQQAEIAGRANDIIGAGGVPRVNPQYSGEMRDNIANGVHQPQGSGDVLSGAGTIRVPRNLREGEHWMPGNGAPIGMVDPARIVNSGMPDVAIELNKRAHNQDALQQMSDFIDRFYKQKGSTPLSISDVNDIRQAEQRLGKSFYDAQGRIADPNNEVNAMNHSGMGSGASKVLKEEVPSTAQSLKDAQDSIYLQRAIQPTSERAQGSIPFLNATGGMWRGALAPGVVGAAHMSGASWPTAIGAGLGTWLATSPEALRGTAIYGLNRLMGHSGPAIMRGVHGVWGAANDDSENEKQQRALQMLLNAK